MSVLYMIVGLPCTGKTTVIRSIIQQRDFRDHPDNVWIASTDDHVEQMAAHHKISYSEAWMQYSKQAEKLMNENIARHVENNSKIIWDQTNLTPKVRAAKLAKIPSDWLKVAITTELVDPETLHERMLVHRPEKVIPLNILRNMHSSYSKPTLEEGFDYIFTSKELENSDKYKSILH